MTMQTNRITAVFAGMPEAEAAISDLRRMGITDAHISSVARHGEHAAGTHGITDDRERSHNINEGTGKGLLTGAGVGALFGLAAAAIPGVGPFISAGVLATTLGTAGGAAVAGAVVGGAAGSLAGALTGAGYSHDEANEYGRRVEQGGVLVAVEGSGNASPDAIRDVLIRNGGYVHGASGMGSSSMSSGSMGSGSTLGASSMGTSSMGSSSMGTGSSLGSGTSGLGGMSSTGGVDSLATGTMGSSSMGSYRNDDLRDRYPTTESADLRLRDIDTNLSRSDLAETDRLQLLEERLFVEKHREVLGSVEIGKHVETRQQQVNVELQHEEIVIERRPVTDTRPVEGNVTLGASNQTVRVDLEAERANVQKQAYVVEEVEIGKRVETEQRTFSETVGREVLDVNRTGDVDVSGAGDTTGMGTTNRDGRSIVDRAADAIDGLDGNNNNRNR